MKNLAAAMVKAQKDMENPSFDAQNPHFRSKYASLKSVIEAVMPAFNKNGISVTQWPICKTEGERIFAGCETHVFHESGEGLKSECLLPLDKANAHGAGSCITYARRYSLMAIAGVVGDEDDDANAAVKDHGMPAPPPLTKEQKLNVENIASRALDFINAGQLEKAYDLMEKEKLGDMEEKLYLWSFFDSKTRTAIKKIDKVRRPFNKDTGTYDDHPATQA